MKLLAFDIEISDIFNLQPGEDLEKYAPFHISIAATSIYQGEEYLWHSTDESGTPTLSITKERAQQLLEYLDRKQKEGFAVCAWNGLNFDFKWLGYQAENYQLATKVALNSYDPMFQFFNQRGFPVGLAKVGEAMGIQQTKLMHGSEAPVKWRNGEYKLVMDYVLGDCQITNKILYAIIQTRQVKWITSKGKISYEDMPQLKPVHQIIRDPSPDQSWMDTPIPKERFYSWLTV